MYPSLDEAMKSAMQLHVDGKHADAEQRYRAIIAARPDAAEPRYYLGFLLQQSGDIVEATALIAESIRLDATRAEWHFNFGIVLVKQQKYADAIAAFQQALTLNPRNYYCWTNLGSVFEKTAEPAKAEQCYLSATQLNPACADAYYLLSVLYLGQERFEEANYFNFCGLTTEPVEPASRIRLIHAYHGLGRTQEAVVLLQNWLKDEPDNPTAAHLLATHALHQIPERCSDRYLETTFDEFAPSFDSTLERLKYSIPQRVRSELALLNFPANSKRSLDLGCGTGLNGASLKPVSSTLVGVDISQGMLSLAREKNLYGRLHQSEISDFLEQSKDQYDLILCTDTFVYFGGLEPVFSLISRSLQADGWFFFSTEKLDETSGAKTYQLNTSGRYSHGQSYLACLLNKYGFDTPEFHDVAIRMESGRPITGQFVKAKKKT
ncbi:tetratricopeptide repeat protein [Candidatus Methylospira mobilis]|nr:tetratricopeptide repeat protein [Candidatus Methylospira mobilis]WNV05449.1 tetratricopeptide repeat protein [Candidatus Methylospira mobilis]